MRDESWSLQNLRPEIVPIDENDLRYADHVLLFEFQCSLNLRQSTGEFDDNYLFQEMSQLPPSRRVDLIETALMRIDYTRSRPIDYSTPDGLNAYQGTFPLIAIVKKFLEQPMSFEAREMERLLDLALDGRDSWQQVISANHVLAQLEQFHNQPALILAWQPRFQLLRQALSPNFLSNVPDGYEYGSNAAMRELGVLLGTPVEDFLERGDNWADAAIADLDAMETSQRALWLGLFEQAKQSKDGKPKEKWLKAADAQLQLVGKDLFLTRVQSWFPLYGKDDGFWFADREERNDAYFKGLVWMCSRIESVAVVPVLGAALRGAFRARGRAGVRSQRVGNACIWALGRRDESEAASHLVGAKNRIKNGAILKTLERTIADVATRAQMTPGDLEELAVPDFGLENGQVSQQFDDASVHIEMVGNKAVWSWQSGGKTVKSVPANVKKDFASELKALKTQVSEMEKSFAAQKERLDGLLREEKSWDFATWKARYLDHPLMQVLAQRVIWNFAQNGETIAAIPAENGFFDARGQKVQIAPEAHVSLYHPLNDAPENVLVWRRYFEENGVKQPFKQAHREIYLLTDAERNTRNYSNRFASHVLKQHQFNSLCAARGWKNQLRLMVDDSYNPATKIWANHDLRAEFWIEGIGTDYGIDCNEAGTYLRLSTDQVRFYRTDAPQNHAHAGGGGYAVGYRAAPSTPLDLSEIPALIFSETMRDVDLFVGVSSLGADPNWSDGGPNGHFRTYWNNYSWGELGESAKSRADVLSRLLPRLKIRDIAAIDGRFLRVKGKKREYKIHLGSGNILMEPNDQYLCIVPGRDENNDVFLPFEGDRTLAVILSKAFLLSEDDKIKDQSIVRQIAQ